MPVANPLAGVNGPRPGRRRGRNRNTLQNAISRQRGGYEGGAKRGRRGGPPRLGGLGQPPVDQERAQPGYVPNIQRTFERLQAVPGIEGPITVNNLSGLMQQVQSMGGLQALGMRLQALLAAQAAGARGFQAKVAALPTARGGGGQRGGGKKGGGGGSPWVRPKADPQQAMRYARRMLKQYGWKGQMGALRNLWTRESGWRWNAANPTSSARGIPQAMMSVHFGSNWQSSPAAQKFLNNAGVQIRWGLDYIKGRYGSPRAAWKHFQQHNWY